MTKENRQLINELVKQVKTKDEIALTTLYNMMYNEIFCFLKKYTFNKCEIEDVISQTFLCVIEKCQDKIIYTNCYSWILTIAKYKYFNQYRKTHREILTDEIEDFIIPSNTKYDEHCTLEMAVKSLSEFDQKIIYLKYHENMTTMAISKILKVSNITIKRRHLVLKNLLEEKIKNEERK